MSGPLMQDDLTILSESAYAKHCQHVKRILWPNILTSKREN